ncbi:MAG: hypothetical protein Q4E76_04295 [Tissierellia bacterium]|nr:hypothetical protein [Tissierellia bacterium]
MDREIQLLGAFFVCENAAVCQFPRGFFWEKWRVLDFFPWVWKLKIFAAFSGTGDFGEGLGPSFFMARKLPGNESTALGRFLTLKFVFERDFPGRFLGPEVCFWEGFSRAVF